MPPRRTTSASLRPISTATARWTSPWRPIGGPPTHAPAAACNGSSAAQSPMTRGPSTPIGTEPTIHRVRFADLDADGREELIVVPLFGRGDDAAKLCRNTGADLGLSDPGRSGRRSLGAGSARRNDARDAQLLAHRSECRREARSAAGQLRGRELARTARLPALAADTDRQPATSRPRPVAEPARSNTVAWPTRPTIWPRSNHGTGIRW